MFKKTLFLVVLLGMLVSFTGCNTVEGMGKDISCLGHAIAAPFK